MNWRGLRIYVATIGIVKATCSASMWLLLEFHEQHAQQMCESIPSIDKPICSLLQTEVHSNFLPR